MSLQMPIIKLELQNMKQAMMVTLGEHQAQISEYVEKSLDSTIADFDYDKVVAEVVNDCIKAAIQEYFKYGQGRTLIKAATNEALAKLFPGSVGKEAS
jgi:formaldehyde-activating enzyme involved in methanogenesis